MADVRGGETEVSIRTADGKEFTATAKCSKKDIYVRAVGLNTALDTLAVATLTGPSEKQFSPATV
jgi:hypothetical protein